VLLVWGLVTSLGIIQVDRPPPPIIAEILEEIQEEDEPPATACHRDATALCAAAGHRGDVPVDAPATTALTNVTNVKPPRAAAGQGRGQKAPEIDRSSSAASSPNTAHPAVWARKVPWCCRSRGPTARFRTARFEEQRLPRLDEAALTRPACLAFHAYAEGLQ
jgi:hypothetical protein